MCESLTNLIAALLKLLNRLSIFIMMLEEILIIKRLLTFEMIRVNVA